MLGPVEKAGLQADSAHARSEPVRPTPFTMRVMDDLTCLRLQTLAAAALHDADRVRVWDRWRVGRIRQTAMSTFLWRYVPGAPSSISRAWNWISRRSLVVEWTCGVLFRCHCLRRWTRGDHDFDSFPCTDHVRLSINYLEELERRR